MSKIVFFGIPAHGHTNPTLEVVRELISREHQVWYYSYNMLREKIEKTGASFIPCDDFDAGKKLSPKDATRIGKDIAFSTKILVDTTLALDDKVCADMEKLKPDCIVADSMALWGKAVAKKLGIPFVVSTTTFAFNEHSAKVMKQGLGDLFRMIFALPKVAKEVRRLQYNGYPVNSILDIIGSDNGANTIVYTSPEFQPCAETFPANFSFVGPSIRPSENEIEKTKDKLIYISMGTVNNDLLPFYKECISALDNTDYQVIISVGNLVAIEEFGDLPENISVLPHADQIAVLEKADVFVSHCGMNSVSESLYYSVPLVMYPQTQEQKGVAERVHQLGAGIKFEKGTSLLDEINKILTDKTYKENADNISKGFKNCPAAKGAADKIIEVCGK